MRPDPYKQKASRKYQASHKEAASTAKERRQQRAKRNEEQMSKPPQAVVNEESVNEDEFMDTREAAELREEENINEFLQYLKDESQNLSANVGHHAEGAYFKLRAEAESTELGEYGKDIWGKLLEVNWDNSLADVISSMPLSELLGVDKSIELPEGCDSLAKLETKSAQSSVSSKALPVRKQMATNAELAPNSSTKPAPVAKVQQPSAFNKSKPAGDNLEAFLDDIL